MKFNLRVWSVEGDIHTLLLHQAIPIPGNYEHNLLTTNNNRLQTTLTQTKSPSSDPTGTTERPTRTASNPAATSIIPARAVYAPTSHSVRNLATPRPPTGSAMNGPLRSANNNLLVQNQWRIVSAACPVVRTAPWAVN